jgi:hypothetical protein
MSKASEDLNLVVVLEGEASNPHLDRAFNAYLALPEGELEGVSMIVRLKGDAEKLASSKAYAAAEKFAQERPGLQVTILHEGATLPASPAAVIIQHNDELRGLPTGYFAAVREHFTNPVTTVVAGFAEYPHEAFDQDHLFLTVQVFGDLLDEALQKEAGRAVARSNNVAFRLSEANKADFVTKVDSQNRPTYLSAVSGSEEVTVDSGLMFVIVSARRQLEQLTNGGLLVECFGHRVNPDVEPTTAHKITSDSFMSALELQLNALLQAIQPHGLTAEQLQEIVKTVAQDMGIEMDLSDNSCSIQSIAGLKARILQDWSRF